jgi:hypothetical protein
MAVVQMELPVQKLRLVLVALGLMEMAEMVVH